MGRNSKYITDESKKKIQELFNLHSPAEISKILKIPYSNLYNYMVRQNIPMLTNEIKEKKDCEPKQEKPNGDNFDISDNKNWLI